MTTNQASGGVSRRMVRSHGKRQKTALKGTAPLDFERGRCKLSTDKIYPLIVVQAACHWA